MWRDQWERIPPDHQQTWDTLPDSIKPIILEKSPPTAPAATPVYNPPTRRVNLHGISVADLLQLASTHGVDDPETEPTDHVRPDDDAPLELPDDPNPLQVCTTQRKSNHPVPSPPPSTQPVPGDIRRLLSQLPPVGTTPKSHAIASTTITNRTAMKHRIVYSTRIGSHAPGSLIDRGANGGLAGADVRLISEDLVPRCVDVRGIDSHQLSNLPLVTIGGVVPSHMGPVIAILHQYAWGGQGSTIHSRLQLEAFRNDVNDRSVSLPGGTQRLTTPDGYIHPITINQGLTYIPLRPFTDQEWDTLPHVVWTSDVPWEPSILALDPTTLPDWPTHPPDRLIAPAASPFDMIGRYRVSVVARDLGEIFSADDDDLDAALCNHRLICRSEAHLVQLHDTKAVPKSEATFEGYRPYFNATTQYGKRVRTGNHMKDTLRSPFPAMNIHRRQEPVATDSIFSDVPAICNGCTAAQIFIGRVSMVCDAYPLKTEKQFVTTLEDVIRKRGAGLHNCGYIHKYHN